MELCLQTFLRSPLVILVALSWSKPLLMLRMHRPAGPSSMRLLLLLHRRAQQQQHASSMAECRLHRILYGPERCSTKDFVTHHTSAISAAIQLADVLTLRNAAAALQFSE